MKLKATLVLLIAFGTGAGAFTWRALRSRHDAAIPEPELRWLQREFSLGDDAVVRIAELHRRYTADCEPRGEALRASQAEFRRLIAGGRRMTPELLSAIDRSNTIIGECQHRMVEHFYAVAKEMPPTTSDRYLALMAPIATHPEQGWMKIAR